MRREGARKREEEAGRRRPSGWRRRNTSEERTTWRGERGDRTSGLPDTSIGTFCAFHLISDTANFPQKNHLLRQVVLYLMPVVIYTDRDFILGVERIEEREEEEEKTAGVGSQREVRPLTTLTLKHTCHSIRNMPHNFSFTDLPS